MNKKILLIDGNFLMFQSFYASYSGDLTKIMRTKNGTPTNAINLFLLQLCRLLKSLKPDYLFIAFDANSKTKRHDIFPEYKANRIKAPEDIFLQFKLIKLILNKLNIAHWEIPGAEADDLIATATKKFFHQKFIFSRDKDLLQLVDQNTSIIFRGKHDYEFINYKNFETIYSIKPSQIPDFKGLKGDPSDNLPGIKGIGDKTAINLLKNFQSYENIFNNINSDLISKSVREKLLTGKKQGNMSLELAKLNYDVKEFEYEIEDLIINLDLQKAKDILKELELNVVFKFLNEYLQNQEE
ncbi:5'-3' exonuclease [Mycoplasmopsis cricetuli]|uniref:5'-3' exonuclease n=1 Tax=Mycoplasmopsis cricetuli TaxID=171283 RepID=UPI00046FE489|nr:5'-3' exonuclease H3TH domain-containing protein [Mycoplasmopsis cricetuli]